MDRRQLILETIKNELTLITSDNGYYNTVLENNIYRKVKQLNELNPEIRTPIIVFIIREPENNDFKHLQRDETGEAIVPGKANSQGNTSPELIKKLHIAIAGLILSDVDPYDKGLLSIEAEQFRKDLEDFFHRKKTISSTLNDIDGVQYSLIKSTQPILDDILHKGGITLDLYIEYFDNSDELNVTSPDTPTISTPSNGATVTTNQPNIVWNSISGAVSYHIQVASDNSFSTLIVNQYFINDNGYTINSIDALSNGTYYVKVRAYSSVGYSDWSSTVTFIVNASTITPTDWNGMPGAISWWNTYSATGLTLSSGISAMKDQIGSRNFTQTTAGARPSLSGSAWGSLSSAYYNPSFGTDSRNLYYNDSLAVMPWNNSTTGSFMCVLMMDGRNYDYNSAYFAPFGRTNTNYGGQLSALRGVNTGPGDYQLSYPFPSGNAMVIPTALNVPHQVLFTHSGSATTIYLDGTLLGTLNKSLTNFAVETNSYWNLGQYYFSTFSSGQFTGHIFEAGFSTSALSSANVRALNEKFKLRFNL